MLRTRLTACLVTLLLITAGRGLAQLDIAGEWTVEFTTKMGTAEFNMFVVQEGAKLSGRLSSSTGEFPLRGNIAADQFTIIWSHPVDGNMTEITFTGTVKGDTLSGRAKVGNLADGALYGERIGR